MNTESDRSATSALERPPSSVDTGVYKPSTDPDDERTLVEGDSLSSGPLRHFDGEEDVPIWPESNGKRGAQPLCRNDRLDIIYPATSSVKLSSKPLKLK
jgi:hypothetical protein